MPIFAYPVVILPITEPNRSSKCCASRACLIPRSRNFRDLNERAGAPQKQLWIGESLFNHPQYYKQNLSDYSRRDGNSFLIDRDCSLRRRDNVLSRPDCSRSDPDSFL
jgi:hypothetical protein